MAVKASAGNKITDNVGALEITAGGDASACYESFKTVRTIMAMTINDPSCGSPPLTTVRDQRDRGIPKKVNSKPFIPASYSFSVASYHVLIRIAPLMA